MTWIKLEDKTPRHPKVAGLSDRAFRVWIGSLCYASEFLTDGLVPPAFLTHVKAAVRAEIVKAGLWYDDGGRVTIHDYLIHQTPKEAVEKERQRNRNRRRSTAGGTSGTLHGTAGGRTDEVPRPDTDTEVHAEDRSQKEQIQNTHNAPERVNGHGRGANTPGSLPRDHRFHGHCSAKFRVCLSETTSAKLMGLWGGPPDESSPMVQEFIDGLEVLIGDGPKGDHLWLIQHFEAFMVTKGRTPVAAPAKPKPNGSGKSFNDELDEWARS